jgi:hypothetical protein
MKTLSQRDIRWANTPLGTSKTTTIGSHGCTITSLAMLFNTTPDVVNKELLRVNGYANTNLIIWTKIPQAFPGGEFITRAYSYNNNQVKTSIEKYGGCLVEVDATRIGSPTHWVLYVGNGKMYDPWTGVEKATSYYPPKGYAVIIPPKNMPDNALQECLKQHTQLVTELEAEKKKTQGLEEQVKLKDEESQRLRGEIAEKASALKTVREDLAQFLDTLAGKLTTLVDKSEVIASVDRLLSGESEQLKKIKNLEKAYALLESEKKLEIEQLKKSIDSLRTVNETQSDHITTLEKRIEAIESNDTPTQDNKAYFEAFEKVVQAIKKLFERKV